MWKEQYKKSRAWDGNAFLVNADTETKVCFLCGVNKYTTDFPDVDEFPDHKLPVCLDCFRSSKRYGRETVSMYEGIERICKECKHSLTLDNFAYRKNGNKLSDTCRKCVGTYKFQKEGDK